MSTYNVPDAELRKNIELKIDVYAINELQSSGKESN